MSNARKPEKAKSFARQQAEAAMAEAPGARRVELAGLVTIDVPPVRKWRSSATHALRIGDFEVWAERTLDPENYLKWVQVDPDQDQIADFMLAWEEDTGEDVGESLAS